MLNPPKNILIIQTAFIGDVILASSVIESLHSFWPDLKIDFLLRKGNESLFQDHPFMHRILIWDKNKNKYSNLLKLGLNVRKNKYDVVINLQRFASTGWITQNSGAPIKIGYAQNPFSRFFTSSIPFEVDNGLHETERNHQLLLSLFSEIPCLKPKLYLNQSAIDAVQHFKKTAGNKYVCIAPASIWFTKQLPESKWVELVSKLPETMFVYLIGANQDIQLCNSIANNVKRKNLINLSGRLSLLQSAALMKDAAMNFVNDSAPMHICSAIDAPTCAVYCSTVPSFGFGPLASNSYVVETTEKLDCRPCGLHGYTKCPKGHFKCAYTVDINNMVKTIYK